MTNSISVLKQTELLGQQFTVYGTADEPMFKAKDVASIIEHSNITKMLEMVDEDEKGVNQSLTPGGNQQVWFLTESGLYEVLMQSRKPIAKQFKKGVKAILKEIRTTGGYLVTRQDDTPEMIMARGLKVAAATIEKHKRQIEQLEAANNEQKQIIAKMQKSNDYLNLILSRKSTLATTQIASDYGMSAVAFNKRLNDMRIQRKVNGQWILYSNFMSRGYVSSNTITFYHRDGLPDVRLCTVWTQKGRLFLYNALKEIGILPLIEQAA